MKSIAALALLPLLAVAKPIGNVESSFSHESINSEDAPLLSSVNSEEIPDSYIVVFKDHIDQTLAAKHHGWVEDLHSSVQTSKMELRKRSQVPVIDTVFEGMKHTYNIGGSLMGYSGHFDEDVIEAVRKHPDVSCKPFPHSKMSALWLTTSSPGGICREGSDDAHALQGRPFGGEERSLGSRPYLSP